MSELSKERILRDLQQAKKTGSLKSERIREIIKHAIMEAGTEFAEGRNDITALVKDAIDAVKETCSEKSDAIRAEIEASIEGVIEAVNTSRRKEIVKTQAEIQQLQAQVDHAEEQLQQEIDGALTEIQTDSTQESNDVQEGIAKAVANIKNSEEITQLKQRYAQLKAQLALIQANLAHRYGEQYEEVNQYLNQAKNWYEKAKADPEVFSEPVQQKRAKFEHQLGEAGRAISRQEKQLKFEHQLGEAGRAISRQEKQLKKLLQELWHSIKETFPEK